MRADSARRFFREFTWTENIRYYLSKLSLGGLRPSGYSGYFDYTPEQLDRLRYVLTQIRREAGDRKPVIVTIPRLSDFLRARGENSQLPEKMGEIATSLNARYVDLLAPMAKLNDPSSYFLPCDGHWNAMGHRVAAEVLRDALR